MVKTVKYFLILIQCRVLLAASSSAIVKQGQLGVFHPATDTLHAPQFGIAGIAAPEKPLVKPRKLTSRTGCGSWDKINSRCYFTIGGTADFPSAQTLCQAADQWATVAQFDNGTPFTAVGSILSDDQYWVGLRLHFNGEF